MPNWPGSRDEAGVPRWGFTVSSRGFLIDGGKGPNTNLAPLVAHHPFPSAWRILVIVPDCEAGLAGLREQTAFAQLCAERGELADRMCRLALLGMTPAVIESDLAGFTEALGEFNAMAGDLFAGVQGGRYAGSEVREVVQWLGKNGVSGAGQSSWGPGVFGVVEDEERGRWMLSRVAERFPQARTWLTAARNEGAVMQAFANQGERGT